MKILQARFTASSLFLCFLLNYSIDAKVSGSLSRITDIDTIVKVWIYFNDKPEKPSANLVSPKAELRRKKANFTQAGDADYPVSSKYISSVQKCGAVLHCIYKWDNCASFYVHASKLNEISNLFGVKQILPVRSYRAKYVKPETGLFKRETTDNQYGLSYTQLNLLGVPAAHDYLSRFRNTGVPGSGILVAVFDAGFRLDHTCFSYLKKNRKIKAMWDFIDNDSTVYDPDSIFTNKNSLHYQNDEHGSSVLSLISGYDPGAFSGTAYGVELVLARTENGIYDGEYHYEEDNWFSAVVWAESIGVDIVSSSLGYRNDFFDSTVIYRSGDSIPVSDYEYSDLDGKTTIVSRAALFAIERGMVIVNAMGNEGSNAFGTLAAPADVEKVISVGAVNSSGKITHFSSTGPTADGRIKPDLVAQGANVAVASVYGSENYYSTFGSGTSFSTPMIAGVCALIMQSDPGITADSLRNRLFRFCKILNGYEVPDNYTGRGLPDALLSCMRDDEVYLSVKDSLGRPLQLVLISGENDDSLGVTDKDGKSLFRVKPQNLPYDITFNATGLRKTISIQSTPSSNEVILPISGGLTIKLVDQKKSSIRGGKIFYRIPGVMEDFVQTEADSLGEFYLIMFRESQVQVYAIAEGYYGSDTIEARICQDFCTLTVDLNPIPAEKFYLYPNVLKKSSGKALFVQFFPEYAEKAIHLSIRTLDGVVVWKRTLFPDLKGGIKLKINDELKKLVPGLYYFTLENNRKVYRRKFLITS